MRKEIGGLKREGVYEEIEREQMPEDNRAAPTQMHFNQMANGDIKCRFVVRGDLTVKDVHWLENKFTMAALEAVRMLSGSGWKTYACDWSQAFVQAARPAAGVTRPRPLQESQAFRCVDEAI
jgi:hypothetical protein